MNDNVLSEDDLVSGLFDAISKGDASAVNKLMNAELETSNPAPEEPAPTETAEPEASTAPAEETVEGTEPATETQEATPADDWRTKLPEDIRDKVLGEFNQIASEYQRLEQYRRSNEGRVAALNRKIEELESAKQKLAAAPIPQPTAPAPAPVKEQDDPVLEELRESDPALYQALSVIRKRDEERFNKLLNEKVNQVQQEVQAVVSPLHKRQQEEYIQQQVKIVYDNVPEIEKVMKSDAWQAFYREASPATRQLLDSPHADEFLTGVDAFTMYLYRNTPPDQLPRVNQAPVVNSAADRVQETRNRRLAASTPTTRAPAASPAQELDDAQYLEQAFQKIWAANRP